MAGAEEPSGSLEKKMVPLAPLLKILECGVCLEVVKIPFKSCQRGHLVCNECNEALPNCPSCTAAFSMDNPVSMKNLLEALPRPCRHAGNGCKEMVERERNDDHEKYCGFRSFGIAGGRLLGEKGNLDRDMISYFKSIKHLHRVENDLIIYQLHEGATSSVSCGGFSKTDTYLVPIWVDGFMFLLVLGNEDKESVEFMFRALFIGKPVNDVFIRVRIERDDVIGSTYTLKAAFDGETDVKLIKGARAIVHLSYIDDFIIDDTLRFDYEIFSKPL